MLSVTEIVDPILKDLRFNNFIVSEQDLERPWGGYLRIDDSQSAKFIAKYFADFVLPEWTKSLRIDPKILLVKPGTRLSWQYHDRRGEVWKVIEGPVGVMTSDTNTQPTIPHVYSSGEIVEIPQGTRHRLIGLNNWGMVGEIWMSTDPAHPTDENDNNRLEDDYGRK